MSTLIYGILATALMILVLGIVLSVLKWIDGVSTVVVDGVSDLMSQRFAWWRRASPKVGRVLELIAHPCHGYRLHRHFRSIRVDAGRQIRAARMTRGLSPDDLAEQLGVGTRFLNMLEKGQRQVPDEMLNRIADATRQPVEFFRRRSGGCRVPM